MGNLYGLLRLSRGVALWTAIACLLPFVLNPLSVKPLPLGEILEYKNESGQFPYKQSVIGFIGAICWRELAVLIMQAMESRLSAEDIARLGLDKYGRKKDLYIHVAGLGGVVLGVIVGSLTRSIVTGIIVCFVSWPLLGGLAGWLLAKTDNN